MGVHLIKAVLDIAPATLTAADRLLLFVLAEQARDETGRCWPGKDILTRRTGLTDRSVRRSITNLIAAGLVERVAVGKDTGGRPVYAHHGHAAEYLITPTAPPERGTPQTPLTAKADVSVPPPRREGGRLGPERRTPRTERGTDTSALPSYPSGNRHLPERDDERPPGEDTLTKRVRDRLGCTAADAAAVVVAIRQRGDIRNPASYLAAMPDDDIRRFIPASGIRTTSRLPPPCGQCDARPDDLPAARTVRGPHGVQKCPRCHPSHLALEMSASAS